MKQTTREELKAYGETLPLGSTYNAHGKVLTYKNSDGEWHECTYNANGKVLTRKDSNGYWHVYTYDAHGRELTFRDSNGNWRGFSNEAIDEELARLKQVRKNLKRSKK